MTDEVKEGIVTAWNRYMTDHARRFKKNEGSSTQYEDTIRLFKQGIVDHPRLSKGEKEELLTRIAASIKPSMQN